MTATEYSVRVRGTRRRTAREIAAIFSGEIATGRTPCRLLSLSAVVTELPAIAARRHTGGLTECGGKRACLDESKRTTDLGYGLLSLQ
jgi:hypothetical protein